jgi:hypothetical protein
MEAGAAAAPLPSVPRRAVFATGVRATDVIVDLTLRPWPSEPPVASPPGPSSEASQAPASIATAAQAPKPTRRNTRGVVVASSLGALAAVGIVAAVMLMRSQVDTGPAPEAAATAVAAQQPVVEPAAARPTVYLRVGPGLSAEERQRIETALAQAGYVRVLVQEMPFTISRSRVGYFHDGDRETAEALIGALRGTHEGLLLRDYRGLIAEPEPGRLELWIRS